MSIDYANSLSYYPFKGKCGQKEIFDDFENMKEKIKLFVKILLSSESTVVLTGAGISTSAGIPDFRGPQGVWTLEEKGKFPSANVSFDVALPTYAHRCLVELERIGLVNLLISQNVDGMHLRSGFPAKNLMELHGNIYVEKCSRCKRRYLRKEALGSVGLKTTGNLCLDLFKGKTCLNPDVNVNKRSSSFCRGICTDSLLDWNDEIPREDLAFCLKFLKKCKLFLCLGTSLQIQPCNTFPLLAKKHGARLVIINLQKTKLDKKADICIYGKLDDVFQHIMKEIENMKTI